MLRRLHPALFAIALAGLASTALAMPPRDVEPPRQQRDDKLQARAAVIDTENLLALHKPDSGSYDPRCLSCHEGVMEEKTLDPRIASFHVAMVPYTPGYNPTKGVTDTVCVQCHKYVDLEVDSSGALRKRVDPALCALCHGPSGPGPVYYMR